VTPRPRAKYRGLGPVWIERTAEAHPVDGGDVPLAEGPYQRDLPVDVKQPLVGGGDRLGANVVLLDPRESVVVQRRDAGVRDLAQGDVARFGEQDRAHADVKVRGPGAALAEMREALGEAGPRADLEQHLGERHPRREHPVDDLAQPAEVVGLLQGVELAEIGAVGPGDRGDRQRGVLVKARCCLPVGAVELFAELLERACRVDRKVQPGADPGSGGRPCRAAEQLGAWVGEPARAPDVYVAALQRRLQRLQHAERVRAPVDLVDAELWVVEDQAPPSPAHDPERDGTGGHAAGSPLKRPQGVKRGQDRLAGGRRVKHEGLEKIRQEPPQARVAAQKLQPERAVLSVVRVGLRGEAGDRLGGGSQVMAADMRVDRRPQLVKPAGRRVKQDEYRGAQAVRGPVEVGQLLVAPVLVLACGLGEQQVAELAEQDQRVVGRVALELPDRRQQRRRAAIGGQAADRLRLGGQPVARERAQPASRHVHVQIADSEVADRSHPCQRVGELGGSQLPRPGTERLQRRQPPVCRDAQQLLEPLALLGAERRAQRLVQSPGGAIPSRGDRSREHRRAGQKHL
jgi:hypothetical protein